MRKASKDWLSEKKPSESQILHLGRWSVDWLWIEYGQCTKVSVYFQWYLFIFNILLTLNEHSEKLCCSYGSVILFYVFVCDRLEDKS